MFTATFQLYRTVVPNLWSADPWGSAKIVLGSAKVILRDRELNLKFQKKIMQLNTGYIKYICSHLTNAFWLKFIFLLLLIFYAFKTALKFVHCTDMSVNHWNRSFYVCDYPLCVPDTFQLWTIHYMITGWEYAAALLFPYVLNQLRLFNSWSLIFNCINCISYS